MEFESGPYKIYRREVKYPRLEYRTGELVLILPPGVKPEIVLEKHKKWIRKKEEFINASLKEARDKRLVQRNEEKFKKLVLDLVRKSARGLGVKVNAIRFRKMRTKWASCTRKRNITINRLCVYLPENLIEYIVFHEIAHLKEAHHNERFWKIISRRFNNYNELEKELFSYWFLIQKSTLKRIPPSAIR